MLEPFSTNSGTRFSFIYEDEIILCTSDLDYFKEAVTHSDIGQMSTGEPLNVLGEDYEVEDISIEHYSWPTNVYQPEQKGKLYDYTINVTVYLSDLD